MARISQQLPKSLRDNLPPGLCPQLQKELDLYAHDMKIFHEELEKIKRIGAGLKNVGNVINEAVAIFGDSEDVQGSKEITLSDIDNNDLAPGSIPPPGTKDHLEGQSEKLDKSLSKKAKAYAKQLINELKGIQNFLNYEKRLKNPVVDGTSIKTLQSAINGIKTHFGRSWGHAKEMAEKVSHWSYLARKKGASPEMKNIQDRFQTLNKFVSKLCASTQTRLQFTENVFKQAMGIQSVAQSGLSAG